jgi:hypothetical protein
MLLRYERRKERKVNIRKVNGLGVVPGDGTKVWGKYI